MKYAALFLVLVVFSSATALAEQPNNVVGTEDAPATLQQQESRAAQNADEKPSSSDMNDALASREELCLDRKQTFANPKEGNPDLPNVLLIGDSISIGYTAHVRETLKGKADVYRIPSNAKNSAYGLQHLDKWLAMNSIQWDVIHFNWGLWGLCYRHLKSKVQGNCDKVNGALTESLVGYRSNVKKIVARLKQTDATLIWCTTTPVPKGQGDCATLGNMGG